VRWKDKGVNFGETRIEAHAGPALVGNFGGNRFFDYTAYGDTINTAARLEAANKHLGTRICVSAAVADAAEKFPESAQLGHLRGVAAKCDARTCE
jgi:class 3 adenylate cyclase